MRHLRTMSTTMEPGSPRLPFEIVRRIIHWRLALSPSCPTPLTSDEPIGPHWDVLAGQIGRQATQRRRKERSEVQDAALDLLRVCKAWKVSRASINVVDSTLMLQPVVMRYLYAEPAIQSTNLLSLTATIVNGDKKWSDLNMHPHSIPGRYVHTLDLSHLDDGYPSLHITTIDSALRALLPLLPNVTHLVLPARSPLRCEHIGLAPFAKRLRCLQGLSVYSFAPVSSSTSRRADQYVWLLRQLPSLEVLSIHGPGNTSDITTPIHDELPEASGLELNRLHTLTLDGVKNGHLLRALTDAELPALTRLLLTSYHGLPGDETYAFQVAHGPTVLSLTYMHSHEWPTIESTPPEETLELHPALLHLSFAFTHSFLQSHLEISQALSAEANRHHPLRAITVPKWTESARNQSPSPSPGVTPLSQTFAQHSGNGVGFPLSPPINTSRTPNRFLSTVVKRPPGSLAIVTIDGFRWVRLDLGRTALEAGNSGTMRNWAMELETRGLEMRDMDGKLLPKDTPPARSWETLRGRRNDRRVSGPNAAWSHRSRDRGVEDGS